ncbi:hypothetical protein [Leifsonia sp. Le1]|uniref:ApeA N-terminal domain 1-containing protein n=1 Tax=Leifsonia sp. Le1 TaxID=3404918 RepID=UPI003EBC2770
MSLEFAPGESFSGVVASEDKGELVQAPATLTFDAELGATFEVSYPDTGWLDDEPNAPRWVHQGGKYPTQAVFQTNSGNVTLAGIHKISHSSNGEVVTARMRSDEAVFATTRRGVEDPLMYDELASEIDGLDRWWGTPSSISREVEYDDRGFTKGMGVSTTEVPEVTWQQGDAVMRLKMGWRSSTTNHNHSWSLEDNAQLVSAFPEPRDAAAHLAEHRKVRELLVLMFGAPVSFRRHEVRSLHYLPGTIPGEKPEIFAPPVSFISRSTLRELSAPVPAERRLFWPVLRLPQIGPEGITRWAQVWDDAAFSRMIEPVVTTLMRPKPFYDDMVLATGRFLDAWGKTAERVEGERAVSPDSKGHTFAISVYRALRLTDADWSFLADAPEGLARAISRTYTSVKHAENEPPDPVQLQALVPAMLAIVRMVAARKVDQDGAAVREWGHSWGLRDSVPDFERLSYRVDAEGVFTTTERDSGNDQ